MPKPSARLALITVDLGQKAPTLDAVAAHLGVATEDIDAGYGIVPLDLDRRLYAVQVVAERLSAAAGFQGPFADGPIEAMRTSGGLDMADMLPQGVVAMMADRAWRMEHYVWHQVRNGWLWYDEATKQSLAALGWEPPRPAARPTPDGRSARIEDNDSGEDFLYMHREMIAAVNAVIARTPGATPVEGWKALPRPGDPGYPVPPAWNSGNPNLDAALRQVKSDAVFGAAFLPWERDYTDPAYLRTVTLGTFGSRLEFTIHNQMHMRWCDRPALGIRPSVEPGNPDAIDPRWDDPRYDWLGDTYSSHVNPVFWKLHGWIDDRIDDWARANGVVGAIPWKGTWLGKMPAHARPTSFLAAMIARRPGMGGHDHAGHLDQLVQAARLIAAQGRVCQFYDEVLAPR